MLAGAALAGGKLSRLVSPSEVAFADAKLNYSKGPIWDR